MNGIHFVLLGALGCSAAVGCGSSSSDGESTSSEGTGTMNGTVGGLSLDVHAAYSGQHTFDKGTSLDVVLTDATSFCSASASGDVPSSATVFWLSIYTEDANKVIHPATETGVYHMGPDPSGMYADLNFFPAGSLCQLGGSGKEALDGTVTVTSLDGNSVGGTYDFTFSSGDRITGTFDPAPCATVAQGLNKSPWTCK